jgi:hypothetical protein
MAQERLDSGPFPDMQCRSARHAAAEVQSGCAIPISGIEAAYPVRKSEAVVSHLSAHADYRHQDYYFARTQSRALAAREWERTKPIQSWSHIVFPALGAAAALLVVAEIVL